MHQEMFKPWARPRSQRNASLCVCDFHADKRCRTGQSFCSSTEQGQHGQQLRSLPATTLPRPPMGIKGELSLHNLFGTQSFQRALSCQFIRGVFCDVDSEELATRLPLKGKLTWKQGQRAVQCKCSPAPAQNCSAWGQQAIEMLTLAVLCSDVRKRKNWGKDE